MGTVVCEESECSKKVTFAMDHRLCALHCQCLSPQYGYDPSCCELCKDFYMSHFINQSEVDIISRGRGELCAHLKKLSRYAQKMKASLMLPPFVQNIKSKSFPPVKVEFFLPPFNFLRNLILLVLPMFRLFPQICHLPPIHRL